MSDDKRQQVRTQGRFVDESGSFSKKSKKQSDPLKPQFYGSDSKSKVDMSDRRGRHSDQTRNSRYEKNKERNSYHDRVSPENNSASKSPKQYSAAQGDFKFEYHENSKHGFEQLETPKALDVIEKAGITVLSNTETGESRIFYKPDFIPAIQADELFKVLHKNVTWSSKNVVIRGVERPQPRLVSWFGPLPYSYSGVLLEPKEFPDVILNIKKMVEATLKSENIDITLNSVLLNLYRDEKDSVAWHSDDESSMGICPTIASVSLGETRRFEMRRKPDVNDRFTAEADCLVYLKNGSLIVMDGVMQDDWEHRVPKEYHCKGMRINLTFRTVYAIDSISRPLPRASYSKNVKDTALTPKASVQEKFELSQDLFPSLTDSFALPQRPKPQRTAKSNEPQDSIEKCANDNTNVLKTDEFEKKTCITPIVPQIPKEDNFLNDSEYSDVGKTAQTHEYHDLVNLPSAVKAKVPKEQVPILPNYVDNWVSDSRNHLVTVKKNKKQSCNSLPKQPFQRYNHLPKENDCLDQNNRSPRRGYHSSSAPIQVKPQQEERQKSKLISSYQTNIHECVPDSANESLHGGEVEVKRHVPSPMLPVQTVDHLPNSSKVWNIEKNELPASRFRESSKGLNPNAHEWHGNGPSVSSYSEKNSRFLENGESVWEDVAPQETQNGYDIKNDVISSGREVAKGLNPNAHEWSGNTVSLSNHCSGNSTRSQQSGANVCNETVTSTHREISKGLNPNAHEWNSNRSLSYHKENSTRSHQTGGNEWNDESPQKYHELQDGREVRNDFDKYSRHNSKEFGDRHQPQSSKQTEIHKDRNVQPLHHYSKTPNRLQRSDVEIRSGTVKSPQTNNGYQGLNNSSPSKQNGKAQRNGPVESSKVVKEPMNSNDKFEEVQSELFDLYDYVASNHRKFAYRDKEELAVLMPIVEISADLPIDILLILTDRLRSLSDQALQRYETRNYSAKLAPRFTNRGRPRRFHNRYDE